MDAEIESCGVLKIETVGDEKQYTFDTDETSAVLPLHDPEGINYDKYKRALVVRITVKAPEGAELSLKVAASGGLTTSTDNWFSNATTYSYAAPVTDGSGNPVPGKVKSLSDAKPFVSFDAQDPNTPIYSDEITLAETGEITVPHRLSGDGQELQTQIPRNI